MVSSLRFILANSIPNRDAEHRQHGQGSKSRPTSRPSRLIPAPSGPIARQGLGARARARFAIRVNVNLGVWLASGNDQNEKEIESAIELAKRSPQCRKHHRRQRNDVPQSHALDRDSVKDLIAKIQRVKREVSVPVTTAEVWDIWLDHPELVRRSTISPCTSCLIGKDMPSSTAVDHAMKVYRAAAPGLSRQAHRDRRVWLAERRAQSQGGRCQTRSLRPRSFATSSPGPTRWASTIRSSKPSISHGRPTKAASVPIGASSTRDRKPKFALRRRRSKRRICCSR